MTDTERAVPQVLVDVTAVANLAQSRLKPTWPLNVNVSSERTSNKLQLI